MTDTTSEAERLQIELIRMQTPEQRLAKTIQLTDRVRYQCKAAIRRRHPEFSEDDVRIKFIEINYGKRLAGEVRNWQMSRRQI